MRNDNFIEDFADKAIKNHNKIKGGLYIRIINTPQGNTAYIDFGKDFVPFDDKYYKNYKNLERTETPSNIGSVTKEELTNIEIKYKKFVKKRLKEIENYCEKNPDSYIHMSVDKMDVKKFTKRDYDISDDFYFNPGGLWYSCGYDYYKWWKTTLKKNIDDYLRYMPIHIYSLKIDNLNIKKIDNCKELEKFNKKYKDTRDNIVYLDIKKVKKDFDGLQMCEYLSLRCNSYFKDKYSKEELESLTDDKLKKHPTPLVILSKHKLSESDKGTFWSYLWKASSGVVWKNFRKIKAEEILD